MVRPDLKLVRGGFQVVSPRFQSTNYGQHLFIEDLVVSFWGGHGVGIEGNGSPEIILTFHGEDSTGGKAEFPVLVRECKDGGSGESEFQGVEGLLFSRAPNPELVLLGKVIKGTSNLCKAFDETAVEVCQTQEGSH
ncbi:hypothetical protein M404DRAFT_125485 [Pisolithus tinctorius Marx 270]|uniref:Uncharacterized protein n=1 Tax=Pisolithus tinctorius Marx 270 TaxID=870435 RepID=A0A0C3PTR7_PISTI|nr:hypothetical protein M404DRAFT_125485 [Pisolithus tinctorius Marx 270]